MFYKVRTHYKHTQGKVFAWMSLILGLAITLIHPILPNFIKTIVHTDSRVSLFYSFLAVIILVAGLTSGFVLKRIKRTTLTKIGFALLAIATFLLIFVTKFIQLAVLITLKTWIELILFIILGLFVRDFAQANNLGREEGLKFRFQNIGALVGLFLGGFLAAKFDYEIVFIATA
ncbi:MAG: MFS transporter, partial [Patescibacteria group bacterium]